MFLLALLLGQSSLIQNWFT